MTKQILSTCLLFGLLFYSLPGLSQLGGWTQKANHTGGNREGAVGFSIGSKGYIAFGNTGGGVYATLWEYDPSTNAWTQKANGSARQYAVAVVINNKAYVGTGDNVSFTRDKKWNEYDPSTNTWTPKTDFGGSARTEAVGFSVGTKGYVGTGFDGALKNDFWEYDPAGNSWTQKANFGGSARRGAVGFAIGSKGYVGTGNDGSRKKDFWEYDPSANTWVQKANFGGTAREGAVGFTMNGKGYIATGDDGVGKKDIWEYDPSGNTWISKATFPGQGRYVAAAFAVNNKGYLGTGFTDEPAIGVNVNDFWEFEAVRVPVAPSQLSITSFSESTMLLRWKDNSTDETGFSIHRSINNIDFTQVGTTDTNVREFLDQGLTAGQTYYYYVKATKSDGPSTASNTASHIAEKYEVGVWTKMGNGPATLLPEYKSQAFSIGENIYVPLFAQYQTVGSSSMAVGSPTTWMYDATNDTWTQKADFTGTLRIGFSAFAVNGKGYVGFGQNLPTSTRLKDLWMYDPSNNSWTQKNNFPGSARTDAFSFTIGTKAYAGSGGDGSTVYTDFWEYDPATDGWVQKASLSVGRFGYVGFASGGVGYAGLSSFGRALYAYNVASNTWTTKTSIPEGFDVVDPRAVSLADGKVFVLINNNSSSNLLWEYQVANDRWIEVAKSPISTSEAGPFAATASTVFHGLGKFTSNWYSYTPGISIPAPNDFKAEIIDPLKIKLSWINMANDIDASKAKLYRASDIGGPYTLIATLPGSVNKYTDNVSINNPVFYKIQIENPQGLSAMAGPATPFKQGVWKRGSRVPIITSNSSSGVALAIGNKGYFGIANVTGIPDEGKKWWEYDPTSDQWTQKSSFPGVVRQDASAFAVDGKGYVGLGRAIPGDQALEDIWQYNPVNNEWIRKADFPGGPRYEASATSIGTKGYVFAGLLTEAQNYFQDAWEYNPAGDTWTAKAPMPGQPKRGTFAVQSDNGILVGGGHTKVNANSYTTSFECYFYEPTLNSWTKKKSLPDGFSFRYAVFSVNGKAYVDFINKQLTEYNAATQSWISRVSPFRATLRGFAIGNYGYVIDNDMITWRFNADAFLAGPTDLTSQLTNGKITLNWTDQSSEEDKIIVEQSVGTAAFNFQIVKELPANSSTFVLDAFENNNYFFRVRAANSLGEISQSSNTVTENAGPYWNKQTTANIPYRPNATVFTLQDKIYYGLGVKYSNGSSGINQSDLWSLDPATNVWTQRANFPGKSVSNAASFGYADKGYVIMDYFNNAALKDFWKYNASSNTWTLLPSFPGSIGVSPFSTTQGAFAYVGMGFTTINNYSKEIWRFDMTSENWQRLSDFPETGRSYAFAFSSQDKLLIGGGNNSNGGSTSITVWQLDLTSGIWTQKKNLRSDLAGFIMSFKASIAYDNIGYLFYENSFWRYYFSDDSWSSDSEGVGITRGFARNIPYQQGQPFAYCIMDDNAAGPIVWKARFVPSRPFIAEAKAVPTAAITIKWRKPKVTPDSVIVFRSTSFGGVYTKVGHVTTSDTTYTDTGLTSGLTYYYMLKQVNAAGRSGPSGQFFATVPAAPTAPSLTAALVGKNVALQWTTSFVDNNQKFVIEKSEGSETNFVAIDTVTEKTFTDKLIEQGKKYYYRVFSYNIGGVSPKSNVSTILFVGLEDAFDNRISIFPSPTIGKISIQIDDSLGAYSAKVLSQTGSTITLRENSPKEIDLTGESPGVYILILFDANGNQLLNKKIIKQ